MQLLINYWYDYFNACFFGIRCPWSTNNFIILNYLLNLKLNLTNVPDSECWDTYVPASGRRDTGLVSASVLSIVSRRRLVVGLRPRQASDLQKMSIFDFAILKVIAFLIELGAAFQSLAASI